MPTIDDTGRFHARGVCTDKGKCGAVGFPIRTSRASTAKRFANKMILELLPGWQCGTVVLKKDGERVDTWTLRKG